MHANFISIKWGWGEGVRYPVEDYNKDWMNVCVIIENALENSDF